jgi:hypothetical protein
MRHSFGTSAHSPAPATPSLPRGPGHATYSFSGGHAVPMPMSGATQYGTPMGDGAAVPPTPVDEWHTILRTIETTGLGKLARRLADSPGRGSGGDGSRSPSVRGSLGGGAGEGVRLVDALLRRGSHAPSHSPSPSPARSAGGLSELLLLGASPSPSPSDTAGRGRRRDTSPRGSPLLSAQKQHQQQRQQRSSSIEARVAALGDAAALQAAAARAALDESEEVWAAADALRARRSRSPGSSPAKKLQEEEEEAAAAEAEAAEAAAMLESAAAADPALLLGPRPRRLFDSPPAAAPALAWRGISHSSPGGPPASRLSVGSFRPGSEPGSPAAAAAASAGSPGRPAAGGSPGRGGGSSPSAGLSSIHARYDARVRSPLRSAAMHAAAAAASAAASPPARGSPAGRFSIGGGSAGGSGLGSPCFSAGGAGGADCYSPATSQQRAQLIGELLRVVKDLRAIEARAGGAAAAGPAATAAAAGGASGAGSPASRVRAAGLNAIIQRLISEAAPFCSPAAARAAPRGGLGLGRAGLSLGGSLASSPAGSRGGSESALLNTGLSFNSAALWTAEAASPAAEAASFEPQQPVAVAAADEAPEDATQLTAAGLVRHSASGAGRDDAQPAPAPAGSPLRSLGGSASAGPTRSSPASMGRTLGPSTSSPGRSPSAGGSPGRPAARASGSAGGAAADGSAGSAGGRLRRKWHMGTGGRGGEALATPSSATAFGRSPLRRSISAAGRSPLRQSLPGATATAAATAAAAASQSPAAAAGTPQGPNPPQNDAAAQAAGALAAAAAALAAAAEAAAAADSRAGSPVRRSGGLVSSGGLRSSMTMPAHLSSPGQGQPPPTPCLGATPGVASSVGSAGRTWQSTPGSRRGARAPVDAGAPQNTPSTPGVEALLAAAAAAVQEAYALQGLSASPAGQGQSPDPNQPVAATPQASIRSVRSPGSGLPTDRTDLTTPMLAGSSTAVRELSSSWRDEARGAQSRWEALLAEWEEATTATAASGAQPSGETSVANGGGGAVAATPSVNGAAAPYAPATVQQQQQQQQQPSPAGAPPPGEAPPTAGPATPAEATALGQQQPTISAAIMSPLEFVGDTASPLSGSWLLSSLGAADFSPGAGLWTGAGAVQLIGGGQCIPLNIPYLTH